MSWETIDHPADFKSYVKVIRTLSLHWWW